MTRIAIIGNAGGGKSLLAQHLGRELRLPVHSVDDAQWGPGWTQVPALQVSEAHATWLASDRWIIDGWGAWDLIVTRFAAADTIVVVDFPFALHLEWVTRRQMEVQQGLRRDWPPKGCNASEITDELLQTMRYVDRELRPRLLRLISDERFADRVIHLRSPEELERWKSAVRRQG
jgi:hypothetical protein